MFTAFPHFRPDAAKGILKDAFDGRCAICILESGTGTKLGVAASFLVWYHVLALMPFARPFRWAEPAAGSQAFMKRWDYTKYAPVAPV